MVKTLSLFLYDIADGCEVFRLKSNFLQNNAVIEVLFWGAQNNRL